MSVTIQLPPEVENRLRAESPNLESLAREVVLVELYRREKLSRYELSQALGLTRFETDGLLQRHHVTEDLPTSAELAADLENARRLFSR
jgi:predicted HTH domain antitoxin